MSAPIEFRRRALDDLEATVDHYRDKAGPDVASRFIDALEAATRHLTANPLTGSLRYAYELDIPELRTWPLSGFPYLIFYISDGARLDVWRVLHAHRDLPASFHGERSDSEGSAAGLVDGGGV